MSVGVTAGSRAVSWHWPDVKEEALALSAACKNEMRWNSFLGGETTYRKDVVITLEYRVGGGTAQCANSGHGLDLS